MKDLGLEVWGEQSEEPTWSGREGRRVGEWRRGRAGNPTSSRLAALREARPMLVHRACSRAVPHELSCSARAGKTAAGWGGGGEAASGGWDRKAGNGREGERGISGGRRGEERGGGGEEWMGGIGRDKIERKRSERDEKNCRRCRRFAQMYS